VSPDMVRLSVGLETLDDILWDLDRALSGAGAA
jgi:O-acetylhomoserine (thiol)-lyase